MDGRMKFGPVFLVLVCLLAMTFLGCSTTIQDTENESEKISELDSVNDRKDTLSIRQQIAQLDTQLTQLKTKFQIRQKNLPVASYYHQNWNFRYYVQDNALMAGVDENGIFFLIDSYNCSSLEKPKGSFRGAQGMELCDYKNSWLELRMRDTTIVIPSSGHKAEQLWPQVKKPIQHDTWLGTGFFCTDFYPIVDNPELLEILADPTVGYFKFYRYCAGKGRGDIGHAEKRDRNGIRDCARLSLLLTESRQLRDSIGE
ncbi:MAG: hypothetical protein IPP17_12775 [Bacteroidetes bacterium]|nr:hypothetical protein [Bacteroidota bacterium]